ncbi:MAG: RDD family protein [Planctomycetota bacterium]|nr:MAG: RDD family protein [Planctomycetota bacterium]
MPQPQRQLDSRIEIVTPENIAFHYILAGPFRRLPAYLIDCGIILGFLILAFIVLTMTTSFGGVGGLGIGLWLLLVFIVSWFYFGVFETLWNGQTPGKRMLGLRVLSENGQPINAMQAILRNVLRAVDGLPFWGAGGLGIPFYMCGLAAMAAGSRYQRLGDLACGTIVVVERRSRLRGVARIEHPDVVRMALQLPVSFTVSRGLAHALSVYVARRERIAPARRYEIARSLAEPLAARFSLPGDTNPDLLLCALYYRTFIADSSAGSTPLSPEREAQEMADAEVTLP